MREGMAQLLLENSSRVSVLVKGQSFATVLSSSCSGVFADAVVGDHPYGQALVTLCFLSVLFCSSSHKSHYLLS